MIRELSKSMSHNFYHTVKCKLKCFSRMENGDFDRSVDGPVILYSESTTNNQLYTLLSLHIKWKRDNVLCSSSAKYFFENGGYIPPRFINKNVMKQA